MPIAVNQTNWRWYRDDNPEPVSPFAAENVKPTLDNNTNIIRLRVTGKSYLGGGTLTNMFLEWSADGVLWTVLGATQPFNYANGQGTQGNPTTTFKTSDGTVYGKYHESNTISETWGLADEYVEMDWAIVPTSYVEPGHTYYFRIGSPVGLDAGKTYPQVKTAGTSTAVLQTGFSLYNLLIEWPYIYVVGSLLIGSTYYQRVAKYQVSANAITLVDSANYGPSTISSYFYRAEFGTASPNHLFCAGREGNNGIVKKIDKNNLSSVAWTYTTGSSLGFSHAKEDISGIVIAAGNDSGIHGCVARLNSFGVQTHILTGIYSTIQYVMDFVNVSGTDYVDINGSYGGYRFIYRYRLSDLNWIDDLAHKYGQYVPNNYYIWNGGVKIGDYYYITGRNGQDLWNPKQALIKIDRTLWALGYPNANVWESRVDNVPGYVHESEQSVATDGSFLYVVGYFYSGPGFSDPPWYGTIRKVSIGGSQIWKLNFIASRMAYGVVQYGDYVIVSTTDGRIEFRKKSDGSIATFPLTGFQTIGLSTHALLNDCWFSEDAPAQSFEIWNEGTEPLAYAISDDAEWLGCVPSSGSSSGEHDTIDVDYNSFNLPAGLYTAEITIEAPGADNTPQIITVELTIRPPTLDMVMRHLKWFVDGLKRACYLGWR